MAVKTIFNAKTQQDEEATLSVDANNEIVATFADGSVVKFPAGVTSDELDELVKLHKDANAGQVVITPEVEAAKAAERAASLAAIGEAPEATDTAPESAAEDAGEQVEVKVNADTTAASEQSNADATTTPAEQPVS